MLISNFFPKLGRISNKKMVRIFCSTFFKGGIWKWLTGSLGATAALFLFGKNVLSLSILFSILFGVGVLTVVFFLGFFYFLITNTFRRSRYGDAIVLLKDGFAGINKLKREDANDSEEIMKMMVEMCNTLKSVFDKLTKVECSVSIKIPIINKPISDNAVVENICRDYKHYLLRNTEEYKKQEHRVNGSTAYQVIITNVLGGNKSNFYYLNNNVPKTNDYQTTSKLAYPDGILPYKSELVYPILPLLPPNDELLTGQKQQYEIWGFLCVDCNHTYKFNKHYHVPIIQGVADGVFDVIMKINKSRPLTN